MKTYVQKPMSRFFYVMRTTAIIGSLGFVVGAGFVVIYSERIIKKAKHWYGEFFKERDLP